MLIIFTHWLQNLSVEQAYVQLSGWEGSKDLMIHENDMNSTFYDSGYEKDSLHDQMLVRFLNLLQAFVG